MRRGKEPPRIRRHDGRPNGIQFTATETMTSAQNDKERPPQEACEEIGLETELARFSAFFSNLPLAGLVI